MGPQLLLSEAYVMNSDFEISLWLTMLLRVPRAISEWFGAGTVIPLSGSCKAHDYMASRLANANKPCFPGILHT